MADLLVPLLKSLLQPMLRTSSTSGGGGLGPELLVNGDFNAGATGWTVTGADATHIATFDGATLRYQSDTTSPQLLVSQTIDPPLIIGRIYRFVVVVTATSGGTLKSDAFTGSNFTGVGTFTFTAVSVTTGFNINRATINVDTTIDSMSVREVLA